MRSPDYEREYDTSSEIEVAVSELFPLILKSESEILRNQYATALANIIGNPGEFHRFVEGPKGERDVAVTRLSESFRHNTELLLHKTWVEEHDENMKSAAISNIGHLVSEFNSGHFEESLKIFVSSARDTAYLLFGSQAKEPDFLDYAFRIDPKLGLFFRFVENIGALDPSSLSPDLLKTLVLIGIFALSSF